MLVRMDWAGYNGILSDCLKELVGDQALKISSSTYNVTPHESLANISPGDVYAGRKEVILQKRKEVKRLTLERRKRYNLEGRNLTKTTARINVRLKT